MNKYYIIDDEDNFWCVRKMKPADAEDKPENYRYYGYWSDYESSREHRIERRFILILPLYLTMKLFGIKC